MIDPRISLAFAVRSRTHAVLLGSGISRAAGIFTGWDVLLDLIRKVAALEGQDPEPDPEAWYVGRFDSAPSYSGLLEQLGPTQAARAQILRGYFEPTDDEREQGLKVPTPAHHALARLVRDGYVRVILTTNFDRLMEQALEAAGVSPSVVTTGHQAAGALPLVHEGARVAKVNGDYLDLRTRNTAAEVERYEPALTRLIGQVLEDFGLIVCGWSAEYDPALRAMIDRTANRRFSLFWAHRGDLREAAATVVRQRRAIPIQIADADAFLVDLADKVQALADLDREHPVSASAAVATVKRYIVDPGQRIRLRDMMAAEVDRLLPPLGADAFPAAGDVSAEAIADRLGRYEARTELLQACMAAGCFHGDDMHHPTWIEAIQRVANSRDDGGGTVGLLSMLKYPALLLLYAGAVTSVAAGQYGTLGAILLRPQIRRGPRSALPAATVLAAWNVLDPGIAKMLPGLDRRIFATNEHIQDVLRDPLRDSIPDDDDFVRAFDTFEYLAALTVNDMVKEMEHVYIRGSPGPFASRRHADGRRVWQTIPAQVEREGADWAGFRAGLFGGSPDRFKEADEYTMRDIRGAPWAWALDLDLP